MYCARKIPIARTLQLPLTAYFRRQFCSPNINLVKYSVEQLEDRGLIRVHGEEASSFLQGLVTNDMRHLEEKAKSMYTMFLNIKGRVMCDTIIYKDENNTFLVECDKEALPTLQKHLKIYRVRKKIDIDFIDDLCVWVIVKGEGVVAERVQNVIQSDSEDLDCMSKTFQQSKIISRDPRLAELGYRLIVPSQDNLLKSSEFSMEMQQQRGIYKRLRYKLGVGEGIAELPPGKCFPLELNCDYLHGVSFHKGCYIGQELTARVHHIGVVRKRLMPIILNAIPKEIYTPDARIENALDKKAIGKLRGLEYTHGLGVLKVSEALAAPALYLLNVTGSTWKPTWWPQEAPKDRLMTEKAEVKP